MRRHWQQLIGLGLLVATSACGGREGGGGGTVVIVAGTDTKTLFPTKAAENTAGRAMVEPLFDPLAEVGPSLSTRDVAGFLPRLAQSWSWSPDSLTVTFALDPRAKWHDGAPVRAADVRFGYEVTIDPLVAARIAGDLTDIVDKLTVVDSLHVAVHFTRADPERFYTFVTGFYPLPEHLLAKVPHDSIATSPFSRAPIGNGPFRFVSWKQGERYEIAAFDSCYRGRPKLDRVIYAVNGDRATLAKQLFAGEADFLELLQTPELKSATATKNVQLLRTPTTNVAWLQFNLMDGAGPRPHPILSETGVRRAIGMALDRRAMLANVFESEGRLAYGPFSSQQWSADSTVRQLPFDRSAAAALLDSLGWKPGADGVRTKGGKALAFTILAVSTSQARQQYAQLIQEQLRQIGIKVDIEVLDPPAMGDRVGNQHKFDAFIQNVNFGRSPSSSLRQMWYSGHGNKGGLNFGGYHSAVTDVHADSAFLSPSTELARRHFRAAYEQIISDAPAIFLFEQPTISGAHKRLVTGPLRPGTWWFSLDQWSIAPGGHLPRDTPRGN